MTTPKTLRPQAERDQAMKDHLETNHYFDEATGELYEPTSPPADPSPDKEDNGLQ